MFVIIEQITKHNFTFVTSKTYQLQNSEIINLDQSNVSYALSIIIYTNK
jgi:hypothetical protein